MKLDSAILDCVAERSEEGPCNTGLDWALRGPDQGITLILRSRKRRRIPWTGWRPPGSAGRLIASSTRPFTRRVGPRPLFTHLWARCGFAWRSQVLRKPHHESWVAAEKPLDETVGFLFALVGQVGESETRANPHPVQTSPASRSGSCRRKALSEFDLGKNLRDLQPRWCFRSSRMLEGVTAPKREPGSGVPLGYRPGQAQSPPPESTAADSGSAPRLAGALSCPE